MQAMQNTTKSLDRDHLSVLVAILLLGSLLFHFIELPEHTWQWKPFGSPLEIRVTSTWLLVVFMAALVCTGTNLILHGHPYLGEHVGRPIYLAWILPGILAALFAYLLDRIPVWPLWIVGLLFSGVVLSTVIAAEYHIVSPRSPGYPSARLALNGLDYGLAYVLFTVIYHSRARSLVTAPLMFGIAFLLSLDLLSIAEVPFRRIVLMSLVVGLEVGESSWVLNYWQIEAWAGGLLLLLIFYVTVNVIYQHLLERLKRRTLIEFAIVAVIVLAVVLWRAW